jgi:hypothetical protein
MSALLSLNTFMYGALAAMLIFCVNPVAHTAHGDSLHRRNKDVQLLQAWVEPSSMVHFDWQRCRGDLPRRSGERVTLDCTDQATQGRPAAAPWNITVQYYPREDRHYSTDSIGSTVEIRVVVRRSILESPTFQGLGFYAKNLTFDGEHFTPKSELQIVSSQDVFLAENGERAVVLRFVLWFPGIQGNSATSWSMQSVEFKPFALFHDGRYAYQNWEDVPVNYRLYGSSNGGGHQQTVSINRENEVLRPYYPRAGLGCAKVL